MFVPWLDRTAIGTETCFHKSDHGLAAVSMQCYIDFPFMSMPRCLQDATSSIDTLRGLSRLAASGMNIVTVIHQPRFSVYELFDSVLLLGVGGVTVYNGPPLLTKGYFTANGFAMPAQENVADWNLDVISGCAPTTGRA